MKKNLLLSIILFGGLILTGTILANSQNPKTSKVKDQSSGYYCNTNAGMSHAYNMYNMHNSYMPYMISDTDSAEFNYNMYHNQCISDSLSLMGKHMNNDSHYQSHYHMMH